MAGYFAATYGGVNFDLFEEIDVSDTDFSPLIENISTANNATLVLELEKKLEDAQYTITGAVNQIAEQSGKLSAQEAQIMRIKSERETDKAIARAENDTLRQLLDSETKKRIKIEQQLKQWTRIDEGVVHGTLDNDTQNFPIDDEINQVLDLSTKRNLNDAANPQSANANLVDLQVAPYQLLKEKFFCSLCDEKFPKVSLLKTHQKQAHGIMDNSFSIGCTDCGQVFDARATHMDHRRRVHGTVYNKKQDGHNDSFSSQRNFGLPAETSMYENGQDVMDISLGAAVAGIDDMEQSP